MMRSMDNIRHHNPNLPLKRSPFIQLFILFVQLMIVWQGYYIFAMLSGNFREFLSFAIKSQQVFLIPISFWLSTLIIIVLAKLFNRYIVLIGALTAEWYFEQFIYETPPQPVVIGYLAYLIIIESLSPYKGGDYYEGNHALKQMGSKIIAILVFLPILYFAFRFETSVPLFSHEGFQVRFYLCLIFLINNLLLVIPSWLSFWILDRTLKPYFPLEKSDAERLQEAQQHSVYDEKQEDGTPRTPSSTDKKFWELYQQILPQPGEVYLQIFTHHALEDDDHTIVVPLGKVRIYFCTRCTAMIFGVIFSFLLSIIIFHDFQLPINTKIAFWLGSILPLFPLLDWGLQALKIRKATTTSRLITGFILGVSMQFIPFAMGEHFFYGLVVLGYFGIFSVLYIIRRRIARKEADEEALQELIS